MVLFEIRQTLKKAIRIVVLASVAAAHAGFTQPEVEPLQNDDERGLINVPVLIAEQIDEIQMLAGYNSTDLIEPLMALGRSHQEEGNHDLAVGAFQRARQVVRVNFGLFSLDEAPMMWELVRLWEARGNIELGWDLEQALLARMRRYPGDLRIVPILREIADKRMGMLEKYTHGDFPPQIRLGCYYGGKCSSGQSSVVRRRISAEAQRYRRLAIQAILSNELYASDELRELEEESIRAGRGVSASLTRLIVYEARSAAPLLSQISALIRLADYELSVSRRPDLDDSIGEQYLVAGRLLRQNGMAKATVDEIFSPKIPVVVPTSRPNPLISEETSKSTGYIDVTFEITKYGESKRIEILDTTTNARRAARRGLVHVIEHSRFRPRMTVDHFEDTSRVALRYYLND
jgi:hypothetical protein